MVLFAMAVHFRHAAQPFMADRSFRTFSSLFRLTPEVLAMTWSMMDVGAVKGAQIKHMIFWQNLNRKLLTQEMVEIDTGYNDAKCQNKNVIMNQADNRAKSNVRSRQENVNSDLKKFVVLSSEWRHHGDFHKHKLCFMAYSVLTQVGYELEG
jgi:hypothetical protein